MSTLAKKLAAKGITLEAPQIPIVRTKQEVVKEEKKQMPTTKSILKTPPVAKKKATVLRAPSSGASSVASSPGVDNLFANLSLDDACTFQTAQGFLAYSHISGRWMDFDFNTEDKEGFVLLRLLLHNGIQEEDFEFEWMDNHTFMVKLKWPTFMKKVLMMTSLDMIQVGTDAEGNPIVTERFPKTHKVTGSMGENAAGLKDENGDIWNVGNFSFKKPMMTGDDNYEVKVFNNIMCNTHLVTIGWRPRYY